MTAEDDSLEGLIDEYLTRRVDRREFFERAGLLGISMSVAGSLLAACGGKATQTAPAARRGGTLREGYDRDVNRPDPVNALWWDPSLYPALHETLIATDPHGKFVPMLAESWETSADGLQWTFKIRSGLTFQTGAPCDAKAVAEAMNVFRSKIATNAGFWAPVKSVRAEGTDVVKVEMTHPYADFPFVLNNGYSAIFNKKSRDDLGDKYGVKTTDGTGPFALKEFVPGSHVLVKRWAAYPGSVVPFFKNKGKPYLDGIRWVVLIEPATRAQELQAGNIDALRNPAPQDVADLKANDKLAVIEFQEPSQYIFALNFKETDVGFDDVRVRQAFTHGIDRASIAKTVFFGNAVPSYAIVNSAWPYYDPGVEQFGAFDPQKSKSLLDQAGWTVGGGGIRTKNGKRLSFNVIVEADRLEQLIAQAVQQMLKDVGAEMNFKVYGSDYFDKFLAGPQAYMFKSLWTNLFDASLLFLHSKYAVPACCNASFTNIPPLDTAFDQWQHAANEDELKAAATTAQLVAAEQVAFIPIVTPLVVWAHSKKVHGWLPNEPNLYPFYNDVWIEA